jgi:hypothetical protein
VKKIIIILCLSFCLFGCSSKIAYNNLDWVAAWYVDDYLDLTGPQGDQFEAKVDIILDWHRRFELVQYQSQLQLIKDQMAQGIIPTHIWQQHLLTIGEHWVRSRDKISSEMAMLAPSLNTEQVSQLFSELKENNQRKRDEHNDLSPQEAFEKRYENILDRFEERIGDMSDAQQDLIRDYVEASNRSELDYLDYSDRFQLALNKVFDEALAQSSPSHALTTNLLALLTHPEQFKSEQSLKNHSAQRLLLAQLLQDIQISLTDEQIAHFNHELDKSLALLKDIIDEQKAMDASLAKTRESL